MKVDRAYKHILDLQDAMARFRYKRPYPYEIFSEDNSQTAERTFFLRVVREIPIQYSALIGDICQNLCGALDHLAWHLVQSSSITPKSSENQIYFPIFESSREYEAGKMRKIQGMTQAAIKAIDDIQPYYRPDVTPGIGNGANLFWLHEINRLDKHRLLIPAWVSMTGHSIPKTRRSDMSAVLVAAFGSADADVIVAAGPSSSEALKDGSKLCTLPISEVDDNMKFRLQIAFGEPKWIRGKEISSTLIHMHRNVREIIVGFDDKGLL